MSPILDFSKQHFDMLEAFGVASPGLVEPLPIAQAAQTPATSFLPAEEALPAMRRELSRLRRQRQVQSVKFDDDGIGFVATLSDPIDPRYTVEHAHWHNNAYWSRYTTNRVAEFQACLRLYRRDSVVCVFSRYPHREVRCFAEAMARADRRILEYKAAHGDELSAVRLGIIVTPAR